MCVRVCDMCVCVYHPSTKNAQRFFDAQMTFVTNHVAVDLAKLSLLLEL